MDWLPLASTAAGAVIALSGTLLVDLRRERDVRSRDREVDSWRNSIDFALALDSAHSLLRDVAQTGAAAADLHQAAGRALVEARLYQARERLLMSGTPDLVTAGEAAFRRLIGIRDVIRAGATVPSNEYHDAYHRYAEAIWSFRMMVRRHFGHQTMRPQHFDLTNWSGREDCDDCATPQQHQVI
ncbi:hypothetical protein NCC78_19715 [Micromonospora phytophila]|uniref:hypothetical protein n=1 Tax=Micromonospora phytophila TaxID=709888 RepID=UPI00203011BE|nr:hypothetical protein [Micromonospora phytophila]MCM0676897.1 hypothetical protein [Micromonospora phytophila]